MAGVAPLEFDHCSGLAMQQGSVFEFTSRFLPAARLEPLLALYALKQVIGTIPHSPADDSVKWAKLKWWNEELLADPVSPSRHPVLRALSQSGARTQLKNTHLQQLISDAIMQIDAAPDSDANSMFERFAALGATEIKLELALDEAEIDTPKIGFLAAASRLFALVSGFAADHRSTPGQLPLNVLAKYNVSAPQLEQESHRVALAQIIEQLAEDGLGWFSQGMSDLKVSSKTGAETGLGAHLQLRWAMEERRLAVIRKDADGFLEAGKRFGPADAWFAWRFSRRLK